MLLRADGEEAFLNRLAWVVGPIYLRGNRMTPHATSSALMELFPARGEWTEADYFPLSERGRLVELSDGEVEVIELPTEFHQLILLRLSVALHMFVMSAKLGHVRFAPLPVRLWPGKIREPDLMFMSARHFDRIGKYWGIPDLTVEIISEGTGDKDREVKRFEYAKAGIPEYWIVDPEAKTLELLRLEAGEDSYRSRALLGSADHLESELFPGLSLNLAEIFAAAV